MKLTKFLLPAILALSLASCGGETKPINQQVVESVANVGSLVMNGSTGATYPDRSVSYELKYGQLIYVTLLVKKNYTDPADNTNKVADVTISYEMDATSKNNWTYKPYVRDSEGKLLDDKGQFGVKDLGDNPTNFSAVLTATISWSDYSEQVSWNINVTFNSYTTVSLEKFRTDGGVASGGYVRTAGYITAKYYDTYAGVFIASGTKAVMLYAGNLESLMSSTGAQIGDMVEVKGQYSPYNGLAEVKPDVMKVITTVPSDLEVKTPETMEIATSDWSIASMNKNDCRIANMSNLKLSSWTGSLTVGSHWTILFKTSDNKDVNIYINYHIGSEEQGKLKTKLEAATKGTTVFNFVGGIVSWYNAPQLSPLIADNLVLA